MKQGMVDSSTCFRFLSFHKDRSHAWQLFTNCTYGLLQGTGSSHVGSQVAHEILDEEIGGTQVVDANVGGKDNGNTISHMPNNNATDNAGADQANNGTS